jgi:DNA-binding response OmpR family regulator
MEAAKEAGCESFITKPIDKNKLLALIKDTLVLMRSDAFMPEAPLQTKAAVSSPDNMTAVWTLVRNEWLLLTPNGNKVKLTSKEFDFISILVSHHKQVVTRQEIIGKAITGTNEESRRGALEALVHRLRHKTRTADNGSPIKTAHGMGYSFSADIRII